MDFGALKKAGLARALSSTSTFYFNHRYAMGRDEKMKSVAVEGRGKLEHGAPVLMPGAGQTEFASDLPHAVGGLRDPLVVRFAVVLAAQLRAAVNQENLAAHGLAELGDAPHALELGPDGLRLGEAMARVDRGQL